MIDEVYFLFSVLPPPTDTSDEPTPFHLKASVRYLKFLKNMCVHFLLAYPVPGTLPGSASTHRKQTADQLPNPGDQANIMKAVSYHINSTYLCQLMN